MARDSPPNGQRGRVDFLHCARWRPVDIRIVLGSGVFEIANGFDQWRRTRPEAGPCREMIGGKPIPSWRTASFCYAGGITTAVVPGDDAA